MNLEFIAGIERYIKQIIIISNVGMVILLVLLAILLPLYFRKFKNNFTGILTSWSISIGIAIIGTILTWIGSFSYGGLSWFFIIGPFIVIAGIILAVFAAIKSANTGKS